jgi:predicted  nucleic acid-binding Zn-ribbon protein
LSLDGFRELLNVMGPRSVIQDTIDESNSRIKQLEADIATQNKTNEKLIAKIEDVEYSAREARRALVET